MGKLKITKSRTGIEEHRRTIDRLNRALLTLLNRRVKAACRIGAIKKQQGLPISDLSREKAIMAALCADNPGPLDTIAIHAIFRTIIRHTKRLERKLS
ncbi:MAG: hypothetical protein A2293_03010 [Elusimicrobia bacterium RIFOXYB2_FULL_49_7]|nr:MAG: hypothetical protein A2293_03010 [Elusimicrobia bacterium RIFOXYB2_FULL_49_7]